MAPIPSCDTEAGSVLTLAVQLAPEHGQGGQADGDGADGDQADAGDRAGEGEGAVDADLGSHSLLWQSCPVQPWSQTHPPFWQLPWEPQLRLHRRMEQSLPGVLDSRSNHLTSSRSS